MKNLRLYVAAGAFIALTGVKLLSPALSLDLRQNVVSIVTRDDDYRQAVQTIGEKLGFADKIKTAAVSDTEDAAKETYTPQTIDEIRREFTSILPEKTQKAEETKETKETEETEKASETEAPDDAAAQSAKEEAVQETPAQETPAQKAAVPKVVQTFLDSQKEYSDYAVPADVSYSMPALPFSYAPPVKGVTSSGFGYRMHPILNEIKFHYGTDFAAQSGTDIYAFADGTVETAEEDDSYGKYIVIDHAEGYKTLYAHCGTLYVSKGDTVKLGQKIALVGQTGKTTGPHLHFELSCGGIRYNPEFYV